MMAAMMAAMLPPSSYDLDSMAPCFFLGGDAEDIVPSHVLPGPGEDIWRKFELLPTPPTSPSRTPPRSDPPPSGADRLEALADLLGAELRPPAALQSFILQDCMWSSSCAAAARLERLESLRARQNPTGTGGPAAGSDGRGGTRYLQDQQGEAAAAACIDPSEVLPFTLTGQNQEQEQEQNLNLKLNQNQEQNQNLKLNLNLKLNQNQNQAHDNGLTMDVGSELSLETPPLSSSESEEEQIDVVTVDRRRTSHPSPLVLKRSLISIQQHNYAAPRPAGKRPAGSRAKRRFGGRRRDVEDEDEDRRRTHNVLERRRRGELRRCLLALRQQVPALAAQPRAAMVTVLQGAAALIRGARAEQRRLIREKDRLAKRSRKLQRRLERLRTLH